MRRSIAQLQVAVKLQSDLVELKFVNYGATDDAFARFNRTLWN